MTFKLYFRYGAMGSSKTANMIMVAYNYKKQGKKILILKPAVDIRDDETFIVSRTGMKMEVDILIGKNTSLLSFDYKSIDCVLVDEINMLNPDYIDQLRVITEFCPVICYGLRTDYKSNLFASSKRLFEIADNIEEVKTICVLCNKKAIMNAKYIVKDGKRDVLKSGSSIIELGGDEMYQAMCWGCWNS
jgi:thymidine kinase